MTPAYILTFVAGTAVGFCLAFLVLAWLRRKEKPGPNPYAGTAQGYYTPRDHANEPTELGLNPDDTLAERGK